MTKYAEVCKSMHIVEKPNKRRITITLETEVLAKIQAMASSQYRSVSAMINWLCRKSVGLNTQDTHIEEIE